ncbi:hypothetical protein K432DRAFT_428580 [Lepidopterella palustris CBS 459.81]|uniref:Uncharacterized protein n=1 Tax=Lepidopterella palustris CBS 459.81 TaxID=1314670 RepID=A0A8E2E3Q5_9PEZI|nr:hypothetical protein K432DRAFT_428580 [Lepidopterella palustris CBS 459.81]
MTNGEEFPYMKPSQQAVDLIRGPLTIVGTGDAPFDLVLANATNCYIFFDVPLLDVTNSRDTAQNLYYASTALKSAAGIIWFIKLNTNQINTIATQIQAAEARDSSHGIGTHLLGRFR